MRKNRQYNRIQLINGCEYSPFAVHPKNWEMAGASTKEKWYFSYRYYDPKHPKPKQVIASGDVNTTNKLMDRRQLMKQLMADEKAMLEQKYFNPITGQYMTEERTGKPSLVLPTTPFIKALQKAIELRKAPKELEIDLTSIVRYVNIAAIGLGLHQYPIRDISRKHIMLLLAELETVKKDKWTANNYNHYRSYLQMLFETLIAWEAIAANPVDKYVPIRKQAKKKQQATTIDERKRIDDYLREHNPRFWLFIVIFFKAGCRRAELMDVQAKNVDLQAQKFTVIRKKGKAYKEVEYTIVDTALPFWEVALQNAKPEDYVFSTGLKSGPVSIDPRQITRRWRTWVKGRKRLNSEQAQKGLGVTANFYSLKHLHSTMTADKLGVPITALFNNESEQMIERHYDLNLEERKHQALKKINHSFV